MKTRGTQSSKEVMKVAFLSLISFLFGYFRCRWRDSEILGPHYSTYTTTVNNLYDSSYNMMKQQQVKEGGGVEKVTAVAPVIDENGIRASRILMGEDSLTADEEVKFPPGSLTMESIDSFGYCYTDIDVYKKHFRQRTDTRASVSDKFKIVYRFVPKSGSSTARWMMKERFFAHEDRGTVLRASVTPQYDKLWDNYTFFTFKRDPLSRFFSGYDESFNREAPWRPQRARYKSQAPEFFYTGFNSTKEFNQLICTRKQIESKRKECEEKNILGSRLERYVRETDGLSPFNEHLNLQVPWLSDPKTGLKRFVDVIYDLGDEDVWDMLGRSNGVDIWEARELGKKKKKNVTGVVVGRPRDRWYDLSRISNSTKQRICDFGLLDYCCLNLPLPPPCENLFCRLHYGGEGGDRLQIQPWSFPTPPGSVEGVSWVSSPSTATFSAGQVVRLEGLSTVHMNGKEALVVSVGTEKIHVRLIGEQDVNVYSVRPEHLVRIVGNEANNSGPLELV